MLILFQCFEMLVVGSANILGARASRGGDVRAMKISDGLWMVAGPGLTCDKDAAAYLVCGGTRAALIDAGTGREHERLSKNIRAVLPAEASLSFLFLTHCHYDHAAGAALLSREFGIPVVAHEKDSAFLESGDKAVTAASWYGAEMPPVRVDHQISGGQELFSVGSLKIQAIHCPGHTPGSVAYVTHLDGKKILFGQDVHGPLVASFLSNREDYVRSLNLLLSLNADVLCEGHYGVVEGKAEVARFIRRFLNPGADSGL